MSLLTSLKLRRSGRDISRREKKYFVFLLIAIIAFNFLFLSSIAYAVVVRTTDPVVAGVAPLAKAANAVASTLFGFAAETLLFISGVVSYIISAFFGVLLYIEAQIIDYLLSPVNFPITNARIVQIGWGITRDLANMFFILILLIIAFTTVLRIKSYAIQQLWWKVVVAALLINFSLVIAGFLIDFTNILTTFFVKAALDGGSFWTITTRLMAGMQILNFYNPARASEIVGGITQFGAAGIGAFIGIVMTLIGLVVTVFVFGAAAIFLVVRILHLWLLMIFAPIVWMLWILPATSSYFSQWWHKFIQWAFFAPIFAFMIFLSLQIFDKSGKFNVQFGGLSFPANWFEGAPGLTTASMPAAIFQWILVIAMMFGSLIVAQKFGVYGAGASMKMLTGWGNNVKGWAGRQLRSSALGVGAKEAAPGVAARPGLLVRGAQKLAAVPGGRLLAGQVFKMTEAESGNVDAAKKQFANWTPEAIQAYLQKSPGRISNTLSQNQQIGAALALKEKGKLDKLDEQRIKELISLTSRHSPKDVDKLLEVVPHMATEFNKKIGDIVAKIEKADQIMLSSLGNSEVVLSLNPNQLKDIAQKANDAKIQKVKDVINAEFSGLTAAMQTDIENNILSIPNKDTRNRNLNSFIQEELDNRLAAGMAIDQARSEVKKLEKIIRGKAIAESPAWQI